jgi:hypothetical protein
MPGTFHVQSHLVLGGVGLPTEPTSMPNRSMHFKFYSELG